MRAHVYHETFCNESKMNCKIWTETDFKIKSGQNVFERIITAQFLFKNNDNLSI